MVDIEIDYYPNMDLFICGEAPINLLFFPRVQPAIRHPTATFGIKNTT